MLSEPTGHGMFEGAERLRRVLLSLPDVALRVGWLRSHLAELRDAEAAELLCQLCEDGERADPDSREALLVVAMFLAASADSPFVERLRQHAEERHLLSLARLLRRGSDVPRAPSQPPVPDYGAGRELTVGERRSLARSPSRKVFEKLLRDPHPLVIRQLLGNPRLTEDDVVRLAARRPLASAIVEALADSPRWLRRPRVRLALLLNPGTPPSISMPLLSVCNRCDLLEVVHGADAPLALRGAARELLERSPPLNPVPRARRCCSDPMPSRLRSPRDGVTRIDTRAVQPSSSSTSQRVRASSVTVSAQSEQSGGSSKRTSSPRVHMNNPDPAGSPSNCLPQRSHS
jgi:hypothetical protein